MKILRLLSSALGLLMLTQCMTVAPSSSGAYGEAAGTARMASTSAPASAPPPLDRRADVSLAERPGLGTQLGSHVHQDTVNTTFYRRNNHVPDASVSFHYNDEEGAKLMARVHGARMSHGGSFDLVSGKLRVTVKRRGWGAAFRHYDSGGRIIVIGSPGEEYEIHMTNLTQHRLLVVTSVDGLDVRTGRPASASGHGYVIAERSSLTISGMRVSGVLRAFRFSTVADSRAATAYGESGARNVGVIGVAMYEEDEAARRRVRVEENYIREGARAFGN
ncbi:MAG: OB-fold nucleic acid binding domain-containing protein [Verrucomicrobiota bacterium]